MSDTGFEPEVRPSRARSETFHPSCITIQPGLLGRLAPGHSHLHLAAHGRFDSAAPLTSGLLLARDREHDGVLTVDEIFSLRLDADLVTLSACETGLGTLNPGDDVIGLTRGLLISRVDKQPVKSAKGLKNLVAKADLGKGVLLQVQTPRGGTTYVLLKADTDR